MNRIKKERSKSIHNKLVLVKEDENHKIKIIKL